MSEKIFPERKCVGCNEMISKALLLRVVKNSEGIVTLDLTKKAPGRGAYVCNKKSCIDLAVKKKGFNRSLKCPVDMSIVEKLYLQCEE